MRITHTNPPLSHYVHLSPLILSSLILDLYYVPTTIMKRRPKHLYKSIILYGRVLRNCLPHFILLGDMDFWDVSRSTWVNLRHFFTVSNNSHQETLVFRPLTKRSRRGRPSGHYVRFDLDTGSE